MNAIILRSRKELVESKKEEAKVEERPFEDSNTAPPEEKRYVAPLAYDLPIPYPQRVKQQNKEPEWAAIP